MRKVQARRMKTKEKDIDAEEERGYKLNALKEIRACLRNSISKKENEKSKRIRLSFC
jgi:hypothetical protein